MSKLSTAIRLLLTDPKHFSHRVHNEFLAPTTWLSVCLRGIYSIVVNNKLASSHNNDDRLLFVYDTLLNPTTFDFIHHLCFVEWMRQESGKIHIDVLVVTRSTVTKNHDQEYITAIGNDNVNWRFTNLLIPLTRLFATVGRVYLVDENEAFELVKRYHNVHPEGYSHASPKAAICRLDQLGLGRRPILTVCDTARNIVETYFQQVDLRQIVTITLRTYDYVECRNSDVASWVDFARVLDPSKYRVIFIPDASVQGVAKIKQIDQFEVFDSACWNLELRAALYQRAWLNMGVACGPLAISGLLDNVWTAMIDRSLDYPEQYFRACYSNGLVPGKAPTFYSKSCRFYLGKDDKESIVNIFNEYIGKTPEVAHE